LSNGYLGMRGMYEEGIPSKEPGVFLNGFYEHRPISYGEHAYGFPRIGQSILNCPDGTPLKLFVDDEPFVLIQAEILSFRRAIDLRAGTLNRDVSWMTPSGRRMRLRTVRLVSFTHRHLAAIEYELTAEDADTEIVISSELVHRQPFAVDSRDPRLAEGFARRVLHPTGSLGEGLRGILSYRTQSSGLTLGCGMDHVLSAESDLTADAKCNDDFAAVVFKGVVKRGKSICIHKFLSYHYSDNAAPDEIKAQTGWTLDRAIEQSFDRILAQQAVAPAPASPPPGRG
jgi:alpha,alpha-trehalose phosphorylase